MSLKKEVVLIFAVLILSQIAYSAVVTQTGDTLDNPTRVDFPPVYDEGPPEAAAALIIYSNQNTVTINKDSPDAQQALDAAMKGTPADALKAGATSVFTPDSIFVNYADTGTVTIKAIGDTQIREYTNAEITYGEVKKGDNEESILPVFIRTSDNKLVTAEVESPPAGSREDTIVRILDEIDITVGVSLSSDFSAITYTTSTERIKFNFCGDSYLAFPEQCETPNTENNVYCAHSITSKCVGTKTAARDLLGRCNDACACSADNFNPAVCVKNSCGASCGSGTDCPSGVCDQNTCSCVAAPCQEDWVCTQYPATCPSNGIKTRTCTDRNGCGTTTNKPQESISCIPQTTTPCNELWSCLEWSPSPCPSSGIQTRTCTDANNCNTNINKPQESRACTPTPITYCGD